MLKTNRIDIKVHWGDCDPADIVFYPQFFRWFDCGTSELFAAVGLDFQTITKTYGIIGTPILDAGAKFKYPARFGDLITLQSGVSDWGSVSFRVEHTIYNGDREAVAGHEVRAWVVTDAAKPSGIKAIPLPQEIKHHFM